MKIIFLFLVTMFNRAQGLHAPPNPCPNIFTYLFDGSEWFGVAEFGGLELGQTIQLVINLSLKDRLPTSYPGSLELYRTRDETLINIFENNVIRYRIRFPLKAQVPRVTEIIINDRVLCSGPKEFGPLVTSIKLEHILHTELAALNLAKRQRESIDIRNDQSRGYFLQQPGLQREDHLEDICGEIHSKFDKPLVYGGTDMERGSWPWMAAIYLNLVDSLTFQCGGNLLSMRVVLTSAHCFYFRNKKYSPSDFIVYLGRHNIRNWNEPGSVASSVDAIYSHPNYEDDLTSFDADIAVILLKNRLSFSEFIRPVCLWSESSPATSIEDEIGFVVGWGRNIADQDVKLVPKRTQAIIVSEEVCQRSNEHYSLFTSNRTFCARNKDGSGPCSGDSGAGLILHRNNKWILRGTVSASLSDPNINSCQFNEFVIYVDVFKFVDWIYSFMVM